jgi:trehalose 6-phosphate phosphatase
MLPPPPRPSAAAIALFLDVDGTLLEIAEEPGAVRVPAELVRTLDRLRAAGAGALALVSGRPLAQIDGLFRPLRLPAAGLHGLERRAADDRVVRAEPRPGALERARRHLAAFAAAHQGVLLEDKGFTLALHYRTAPEKAAAAAEAAAEAVARSDRELTLLEGKMVFELKPPDVNKGKAIEAFMGEPPFAGRLPVFVGDDVTDEAGFEAVNGLGGLSLRVAAGADRPTRAQYGLPDVPALHGWLAEILRAAPS